MLDIDERLALLEGDRIHVSLLFFLVNVGVRDTGSVPTVISVSVVSRRFFTLLVHAIFM